MRLIDADLLKANVPNTNIDVFENCRNCSTLTDWEVKELIDKQPTIDVVRCKDCKWHEKNGCELLNLWMMHMDDFFCAFGEENRNE